MDRPRIASFNPPECVMRVVEALATHLDQRGVVLGGGRGETGDMGPGRDWDLFVYVEDAAMSDRLDFTSRIDGFRVARTPNMPFVCAEGGVQLASGDAVDVLFVDIGLVHESVNNSRRGSFSLCPMARLISGMPSYVVEAEIALGIECSDGVPAVPANPPDALVVAASSWWYGRASLSFLLAGDSIKKSDSLATTAHLLAAAQSFCHRIGLQNGWYLPSKAFVSRALKSRPYGEQVLGVLGGRPSAESVLAVGEILGLSERAGLAWAAEGRERGVW